MRKDIKYKFNIWNFTKPKSLFNDGMRPVWYSKRNRANQNLEHDHDAWDFIPEQNFDEEPKYFKSDLRKQLFSRGIFDKVFLEDEKEGESG